MKYAAFLRGIGPSDPNMRNEKLREVFAGLGFEHVQSLLSSGNLLFESDESDIPQLESRIEKALRHNLHIKSTVFIRKQAELQELVDKKPFGNRSHKPETYLTVTFVKHLPKSVPSTPLETPGKSSTVLHIDAEVRAICTVTDNTAAKTPNFMSWLEKQFGKDVTTRTWNTMQRVLKKMTNEVK